MGSSKVAVVDALLVERDALLRKLKENLLAAKNRMREQANRKRHNIEFSVGDKVLIKLQPYRQITLAKCLSNKLAKRFYGSYEIVERIGKVAYRLALPITSKIHPVFHVSILKLFTGTRTETVTKLQEEFQDRQPMEQPVAICDSRLVLQNENDGSPTFDADALLAVLPNVFSDDGSPTFDADVKSTSSPPKPDPLDIASLAASSSAISSLESGIASLSCTCVSKISSSKSRECSRLDVFCIRSCASK
ncbi:hypothetical protein Tco_0613699 [Tanacetum coccineum]